MSRLPNAVFVSSLQESRLVIFEAQSLEIPVVSVVDSNCDSGPITFPIPGNDDALDCVKLYSKVISKSILSHKLRILTAFRRLSFNKTSEDDLRSLWAYSRYSSYNINGFIFEEKRRDVRRWLLYICIYFEGAFESSLSLYLSWNRFNDYNWRMRYIGKFNWLDILGDVSRNKLALNKGLREGLRWNKGVVLNLRKRRLTGET